MGKTNRIIMYFGCIYLALGLAFIVWRDNIIYSNVNLSLLVPVVNGIVVSSLLFGISDAIEQVLLANRHIIALNTLFNSDISEYDTKLKLREKIETVYNSATVFVEKPQVVNMLYKPLQCLASFLGTCALPMSVVIILVYSQMDDYLSMGVTLLVFGLFVLSYGYRAQHDFLVNKRLQDIWLKYYEMKEQKGKFSDE